MLYNKDYLFIHIPRTAGKCIKSSLIPILEKPIYLAQKKTHPKFFNKQDFIQIKDNFVHLSLEEIEFFSKKENELPNINNIKNIIICLRNPLDRVKSLYKFHRFKGTYSNDFESFILKLGQKRWTRNIKSFCTINNEIPKNVKFIKFDSLEKDLCKLLHINYIDINTKKHNQLVNLNQIQKNNLFKIKNINKAISIINTWEEWSIQKGLFNPVTEKDFL